ncbi:MAG: AAA family ATPase [Oscillospiraceae bacterium]|nr:AAA family ATPase [Oscillospiraceae bacterium]
MKYIWIFGPPAVGKMTVGQEIEKITGLKLFHNHMVMDLVSVFFDAMNTDEGGRLSRLFIEKIFEAVSKSDLCGLIYTSVCRFDRQGSWEYANKLADIFESRGAEVYFVELEADVNERIIRNKTPNRLAHKPSKRNIENSDKAMIDASVNERANSFEGEIKRKNYIRINNTKIEPDEVAKNIKDTFAL